MQTFMYYTFVLLKMRLKGVEAYEQENTKYNSKNYYSFDFDCANCEFDRIPSRAAEEAHRSHGKERGGAASAGGVLFPRLQAVAEDLSGEHGHYREPEQDISRTAALRLRG